MEASSKGVGLWNKYGQCIVVDADTADLPHVEVHWYLAGIGECGHTHVAPGETDEQAARRAYGHRAHKDGSFEWRRVELSREYPKVVAR